MMGGCLFAGVLFALVHTMTVGNTGERDEVMAG